MSLGGHGLCSSRGSELGDDFVESAAPAADHKHDLYDSMRGAWGDAGHIQVDLGAARAVWVHRIGAGLTRSKTGRPCRPKAIALIIFLSELAFAIERCQRQPMVE